MHEDDADNVYWLSRDGRIVEVGRAWDAFALANEGKEACRARVLGSPIWTHIRGDETRMWLEAILQMATVRNEAVERTYRCDSPEWKRFMRMLVVPEPEGRLRVEHALLRQEPNRRPVCFRCPRKDNEPPALHFRCSICGRVQQGETWVEADTHAREPAVQLYVCYRVCPDCRRGITTLRRAARPASPRATDAPTPPPAPRAPPPPPS